VKRAYTSLLDDPGRPLENRAIASRLYPPGSTFKLVTAAAALESGMYQPDTEVEGPAALRFPGMTYTLPNDFSGACSPSGKITLIDALKISCNTAFGSVGMAVGESALAEQARKFGFGEQLKIPLTVTPSQFPSGLSPDHLAQSAIGQYEVRVSPLQMAMISAAIANKGVLMKPRLIDRLLAPDLTVMSRPGTEELGRAVSRETAAKLTSMMETVVASGTGRRARIDGVTVAGKTGTAEQGKGKPPNAWFTAFAPADDPVIAVAVVVEDGGSLGDAASGGRVAAPIAKQVMEAVINQ
jgi:peptidoglycan glycosyltransferase